MKTQPAAEIGAVATFALAGVNVHFSTGSAGAASGERPLRPLSFR